ncbi:MAG: ribosome recycling factor [Bauldia sp.]|nr:ribosome recycling factor [Bauldia sp.]MCW5718992.1 ribosome recycling factor [Bauldia sp.]
MNLDDLRRRMQGAITSFQGELGTIRTGRASSSMLDPVVVSVYGSDMPINQVATVTVPEARMLMVQVWDRSAVQAVDRAIREANLGLNPVVEGATMRIPIPELNRERRQELVKVAHKYAEAARVAVRHVRRDGLDGAKKEEKDGKVSQDEHRIFTEKVQKLTDDTIAEIDKLVAAKEAEILQI